MSGPIQGTIFIDGKEYYLSAPNTYTPVVVQAKAAEAVTVQAKAAEPIVAVKAAEPVAVAKTVEPVTVQTKAAEPVKRLIGFSHSVKQVTTDVHSFELFLSTEIYDYVGEKLGFFMSSTTKLRVYAGSTYGDQDAIACAKNLGKRVDLMKVFPTIKAEQVEMIKATLKELREAYENRPVQTDPFDGLEDL